ncbi:methyltransferase [Kutzneria buriramensis]|uniref:Methyltransferase family protein n=1 Tax=Kutzneria buriramensis TaxID=1045776 RepID=A0A3E0GTP3_9PSEU|nr:methyltransferase [Kutzneria buriramensis]REH26996.1 methyltransferase family protein [Kutzneria buriramensis]
MTNILPLVDTGLLPADGANSDVVMAAHRVYEHLIALWAPGVIEAAHDLGVFDALGTAPARADELAEQLGTDTKATGVLLEALYAYEIVAREVADDGVVGYTLAPAMAEVLSPTGLFSLTGKIGYDRKLAWDAWRGLADAVRSGRYDASGSEQGNRISEYEYESLVTGINFWAPPIVRELGRALRELGWPTTESARMLDIGCGSGLYSHLLLQEFPGLSAVGIDVELILKIAVEQSLRLGVADRFATFDGDFTSDDLGRDFDLVLLVNIFHLQSGDSAGLLAKRVASALGDNGIVAIVDQIIDDRQGPRSTHNRFFRLFATSMLATGGGGAYTVDDYDAWLESAGLHRIALVDTPMHRVLLAKRS